MSERKRSLAQIAPGRDKLDQPTIMNAALAAKYGTPYVKLAAFAIDIDRVYVALEDEPSDLPFGWEVFLTECYLVAFLPAAGDRERALLEETCLSILEQPPDAQGYGSHLLFAVHDAVQRGYYPRALAQVFRSWHKPPKQLTRALDELWSDAAENQAALAAHVLAVMIDPPLAPPTEQALTRMAEGKALPPPPASG